MTNSNGQGGSAPSLDAQKRAARAQARVVMAGCDPVCGLSVGNHIAANVTLDADIVVAGYFPMKWELDITPLLRALRGAGHIVALPRTKAVGSPLAFHRWAESDGLVPERFGTTSADGPVVEPHLLLVPLLAFDRRGHRLGYGGGFYDRTIAARPGVRTIGCAYAALELPEVPTGPTDMPLDAIATEREFITIKAPPCASCF